MEFHYRYANASWIKLINSRLVEEVGVGIEVIRSDNGKLLKGTFAEVIDKVVIKEEGKSVRMKAKSMSIEW
ncbi:hypothetical protein Leryth_005421 [Lithospermum erythrorhizon]|nr:hypothetical protein Leryth_005421 [Lithospermum erythrorhizon]